ncbi:hypothetical protein PENANT_c026G00225 [Penicillium antarcticum]|uniref:Heterokaryon incompatibility domain-containing protein n=1 Tax=Penicillium antarcticum TaxID=416450 RepID=A0A1V6PX88_9EURO|nr:uncharacterized protein N7508_000118 [Penicillium antarcticum]KAJ5319835.1 hypothetical protein N7508_000118 [Penicillium antarcticum]OQD81648.1 hypothetical protein PENANT_c026G00225 [Penicillium antarcticum]
MAEIPPNNPNHPRWLLDLENWAIRDYREIEDEVLQNGYGIISYTWGRWASWNQVPPDVPAGLQWPVPLVEVLPLGLARRVVSSMGIQYVWWDWMCVPQGNASTLQPELLEAKGQEVGKQMVIYQGAKRSIVWLHQTTWGKESPVEKLLKNQIPKQNLPEYLAAVDGLLQDIQAAEPWLTSGWTLQEGVLLSETLLLDHEGEALRDERFLHNQGQASVLDLTAGLTTFAIHIATAFLKMSETQDGGDYDEVVQFIRASDANYQNVAQFLGRLLRSGLIAYTKKSPLYILAGKFSRNYGVQEDQCWALLGALELANVTPWYSNVADMDRVKSVFFANLLQEHQWSTLLVAGAGEGEGEQKISQLPWHLKVTDGNYLPLGIFFDVNWKPDLPGLSWTYPSPLVKDAIHIQTKTGAPFAVLKARDNGSALCRRYEQLPTADEAGSIRILPVGPLEPSKALFFPIADLESRPNMPGSRCIEIIPTETGAHPAGIFRGVIDIWATEATFEKLHYTKLSMLSGV